MDGVVSKTNYSIVLLITVGEIFIIPSALVKSDDFLNVCHLGYINPLKYLRYVHFSSAVH